MTNNTSDQINRRIAARYEGLKFEAPDKKATPTTRFRAPRKAKRRTIR